MSRRTDPSLARKLHEVHEEFASLVVQSRCLHQKAHLGDLDFLAVTLKALETAARKAGDEARRIAEQERKAAEM